MKTRIPVVLALAAALALAACAPAQTASAPQNEQTAETAQNAGTAPAQETAALPAVAGELYALAEDGAQTCLFNAGDCGYELLPRNGYMLVSYVDYATAEQRVLCSVPGCAHASEDCPAYLAERGNGDFIFAAGQSVYIYHPASSYPYTGSWEEYYDEYVRPGLADPALREGMTEQEFAAFHRGWYGERSLPAGLFVLDRAGTARRWQPLSRNLDNFVTLYWCDGAALYGYAYDALPAGNSAGYRIALADGGVTNFPLTQYERIEGAQGDRLLTTRPVADAPLPDPNQNREAYAAALQNAVVEYGWLDPATGARSKILETPYQPQDGNVCLFRGLQGGKLYFHKEEHTSAGAQLCSIWAYDPAAGSWQAVVDPLAHDSMFLRWAGAATLPGTAEQAGRYLWLEGSRGSVLDLGWVWDAAQNELTAIQQTMAGDPYARPVRSVAQTDDGRFLVRTAYRGEGELYDYGLIGIDAFLQGSTAYTPVQMLA